MNKRGSISILVAATVPVALVASVFAIDAARTWVAQSRLQTALDAAALTAARDMDSPDREKNTRAVLAANFSGGAPGESDTGWGNVDIKPSADGNSVTVTGSVTVNPIMNNIIGLGNLPGTSPRTIVRSAVADRALGGLELALVVDITLSMIQADAGGGKTRIQAAREAMDVLLEILYGDLPPLQNGAPNPANRK